MFRVFLLMALACASDLITDPYSSNASYPELAAAMLPRAMNASLLLLRALNISTLPSEVKPMRLSLLRARELVDLFLFAYDPHPQDLISFLRHDLDEGYESIGMFQDLDHTHVEYSKKDLIRYLDMCLKWKSSFIHLVDTHGYLNYLSRPSMNTLFTRDHISPLFWGCCNIRPSLDLDGMANFAFLASSMSKDDADRTGDLLSIESEAIISKSNHIMLHSYRKSLRSLSSLLFTFPDLIRASSIYPYLDQAFHSLGKVTDGIFSYEFYRKKGKGRKAEAAREITIGVWIGVKSQLIAEGLEKRLADFALDVISSIQAADIAEA